MDEHPIATVLVADDDSSVRDVIARLLTTAGYRVLVACDGQDALTQLKQHADRIGLVLLDVVMPHLNGHDALARMRAVVPSLPAVFLTGYDPEEELPDEYRHSCPVLIKPCDFQQLLATVAWCLDRPPVTATP